VPSEAARLVVAIDGPSGSGKSTVARAVAERLGLRYLDTGAMYRAATWLALHRSVSLDDAAALTDLAETADLQISTEPVPAAVTADGTDVTTAIRSDEVTSAVSQVSATPGVRTAMVRRQRQIIGSGGIVVEGRDIGTTVAPEAAVKVFLTADPEERARRRAAETAGAVTLTRAALEQRDMKDSSRKASPLTQAGDALVLDSTHLTVDEVVDAVADAARAVLPS
jgi:cytidylate kinase